MIAGSAAGESGSGLFVVGVDGQGAEVFRSVLGHGADPSALLAWAGWRVRRVADIAREPQDGHVMTMTFVVEPSLTAAAGAAGSAGSEGLGSRLGELPVSEPLRDDKLMALEAEVAVRHQRVAAYALVTSSRGILMTQFSDQTNAPGQWGFPGGGLEPGESPYHAVSREVWEESGQRVEVGDLASIQTSHWVGRAPSGQLQDFHAVRAVYRAVCPEPTEPVVHDVGGTTAAAEWLRPADLASLELTPGWRAMLAVVMMADEPDSPDHSHHDAEADDRTRPQP